MALEEQGRESFGWSCLLAAGSRVAVGHCTSKARYLCSMDAAAQTWQCSNHWISHRPSWPCCAAQSVHVTPAALCSARPPSAAAACRPTIVAYSSEIQRSYS